MEYIHKNYKELIKLGVSGIDWMEGSIFIIIRSALPGKNGSVKSLIFNYSDAEVIFIVR